MKHRIISPGTFGDPSDGLLDISEGGTGGKTPSEVRSNLGLLSTLDLGIKFAKLDSGLMIPSDSIPSGSNDFNNVNGPRSLVVGQSVTITITDYDSRKDYVLTAIRGSVSRSGETITYNAPTTLGTAGFILNGKNILFNLIDNRPPATIYAQVRWVDDYGCYISAIVSTDGYSWSASQVCASFNWSASVNASDVQFNESGKNSNLYKITYTKNPIARNLSWTFSVSGTANLSLAASSGSTATGVMLYSGSITISDFVPVIG